MTPFSDVIYGDYGGIANAMLENRRVYNIVKDLINENILICLLHSINPATRLCAAELYFTQKKVYQKKELIEKLIKGNLKELPRIETMSGCSQFSESAQTVLNRMIDKYK